MHRSNVLRAALVGALFGGVLVGGGARAGDEVAPPAAVTGPPAASAAPAAAAPVAPPVGEAWQGVDPNAVAPLPESMRMPDVSPVGMADLMIPFAKTMLGLLVVLGLIYLTLHKGLGTLVAKSQIGKRMKLVERVNLDQRRAIYLVEVDGKEMVLAGGEGGVVKIVETAKREVPAGEGAPAASTAERFMAALSSKKPNAGAPPVTGLPRTAATHGETQEG